MLDLKYRPATLDKCIGHTREVTVLQGYVKSGKFPQCVLITGPTSVGKTTLGRAFAATINGLNAKGEPYDYEEVDGAAYRTREALINLVRISKFMPQQGKRRIILIDEFQEILTNPHASSLLLKEVEEPSSSTIWILCSMDPAKFATDKNGKALMTRCVHLALTPPTEADMYAQAVRIAKGEGAKFFTKEQLAYLSKNSDNEMRTLAHRISAVIAYHSTLEEARRLTMDEIKEACNGVNAQIEASAADFMIALYSGKFKECQLAILNLSDNNALPFVNQCLYIAKFMLNVACLDGAKHPKVWWTPVNRQVFYKLQKSKLTISDLADALRMIVGVRSQMFSYGNVDELLTVAAYNYLSED